MSDLLERYLYEVTKRLPKEDREDVERELHDDILDMTSSDNTEEAIGAALERMGSPSRLAEQYRRKKRYLVSPANYDTYLFVLKVVSITVALTVAVVKAFSMAFDPASIPPSTIIASTVVAICSTLIDAAFWITVAFVLLDRLQLTLEDGPWTLAHLPKAEEYEMLKIKRSDAVADVVGSSIFIVLLLVLLMPNPNVLAVYGRMLTPVPIFIATRFRTYLSFMLALAMLPLALGILKIQVGTWRLPLIILDLISDLASLVLFLLLITDWDLLNPQFTALFSGGLDRWKTIARIIALVFTILTAIGFVESIVRLAKHAKAT